MTSRGPDLKTWPLCTVILQLSAKPVGKKSDTKMDHKGTDINWLRKGKTAKFLQQLFHLQMRTVPLLYGLEVLCSNIIPQAT
jgi:hypothetical protein